MKLVVCRTLLFISFLLPSMFLVVGFLVVGAPTLVSAQGEDELARRLVREGIDAVENDDWETAQERFDRAYELSPRPLTLYNLATAQMNTGDLVSADENFRQFLRETSSGQHQVFRDEARAQREDLSDRIPFARIEGNGIERQDQLTLDDERFSSAGLGENIAMNPGEHMLIVERNGVVIGRRVFNLREGQTQAVRMQLIESAVAQAEGGRNGGFTTAPTIEEPPSGPSSEEETDVAESPAFWVVVVGVLAAGAVAAWLLVAPPEREGFAGDYAVTAQ